MILTGKPKYLEKNLSQCHFIYHKSHVDSLTFLFSERTASDHLHCSIHNSVLISVSFLLHILMPFSYIDYCFTVQNCT
jgi:hypothetical protein